MERNLGDKLNTVAFLEPVQTTRGIPRIPPSAP